MTVKIGNARDGSVRQNHLRGAGDFVASWDDKIFSISSLNSKVVLLLGSAGEKLILYNNYNNLGMICGAQKTGSMLTKDLGPSAIMAITIC